MKKRKVLLWTVLIAFFGVGVFSGYEVIRTWRTNKAVRAMTPGDPDAFARYRPLLDDHNPWMRSLGCQAMGRIGPAAKAATPELIDLLKDHSQEVRIHAAWALGHIGAGAAAIPPLIAALDDEDSEVRRYAAHALMLHGPLAEPAVAKLIERMQSADIGAYMAARALGEIGPSAKASIPHLHAQLKKEQGLVRIEYAVALGKFGSAAKAAIPDILPLTRDPDPAISQAALGALKSIDPTVKAP